MAACFFVGGQLSVGLGGRVGLGWGFAHGSIWMPGGTPTAHAVRGTLGRAARTACRARGGVPRRHGLRRRGSSRRCVGSVECAFDEVGDLDPAGGLCHLVPSGAEISAWGDEARVGQVSSLSASKESLSRSLRRSRDSDSEVAKDSLRSRAGRNSRGSVTEYRTVVPSFRDWTIPPRSQDGELLGQVGLFEPDEGQHVGDGSLAVVEQFQDPDPGGVAECLEKIGLHLVDRSGHVAVRRLAMWASS